MLTSARLRSIKASKKMIQELSSSSPAARIPRNRLQLNLESLTRNIGGGWNLGGLNLGDGVSLVKAANGQVYKMTVRERSAGEEKQDTNLQPSASGTSGAFHPESLDTIASVNHWRCGGFPLYGQVKIYLANICCCIKRFPVSRFIELIIVLSGNLSDDVQFLIFNLIFAALRTLSRVWRSPAARGLSSRGSGGRDTSTVSTGELLTATCWVIFLLSAVRMSTLTGDSPPTLLPKCAKLPLKVCK